MAALVWMMIFPGLMVALAGGSATAVFIMTTIACSIIMLLVGDQLFEFLYWASYKRD